MSTTSVDMSWQIINQAWTKAEALNEETQSRLDDVKTAMAGTIIAGAPVTAPISTINKPVVDIPLEAMGPDLTLFNQYNDNIINKLVDLFSDFLATYFPLSQTTMTLAEQWLQNQIQNGGTGVNAAVEAQLHERERSRALADAQRAENEITESWAAKRFPMPPGALAYQVLQVQQKAQDEIAKSSRETMIKAWEVEVDMVKFAIDEALKARQIAISAAGDYIKDLAMSQNTSYQLAMGQSQAQNALIQAAAAYYNAEINAQQTMFASRHENSKMAHVSGLTNAEINKDLLIGRGQMTHAGAEVVGRQAQAMLNNLHTSVGVQGQERIGA